MTAWLPVGMVVAGLPFVLALSWAVQRRMTGRFVGCLVASLLGAAGLAALLGYLGACLTYDPHENGPIGNWSALAGLVIGSGVGWIGGAVAAPAVLLRLFGVRVDGARLLVGVVSGSLVSGVLFWLLEMTRFGHGPSVWPTRTLMMLSSSATFAALVLASRARLEQPATG
jgi:hypothetical protein